MKVKELIQLLEHFDPDMDIVIKRDVDMPGYGFLDRIETGIFSVDNYGNDFYWGEAMTVNENETPALCLVAEDDLPEEPEKPRF